MYGFGFIKVKEMLPSIVKTIKNSKRFVVVISENYVDSTWCVDELAEIFSSSTGRNVIIPVFYYVNPSDIRLQKGRYGGAFKTYKKHNYHADRLKKWEDALVGISELSGFHLRNDAHKMHIIKRIVAAIIRPERDVINEIVDRVLIKTNHITFSSSLSPSCDVFLSFYGKDTCSNFIAHLYSALEQAGIVTFRYDPALETGKEISSEILNTIKSSKQFVVVVSKNYAHSPWCLYELVEILSQQRRSNHIVPVFYYVDPSDVRHQKGSFSEALDIHKKRCSVDIIDKWTSALAEIANLSGYHLKKDANENESETIQDIVEELIRSKSDIINRTVDRDLLKMKSLTSSSSSSSWDVFLSFYGKDTHGNFISHLYSALDKAGIITFRDAPALEMGKGILSKMYNAIRDSEKFVVVVSENYLQSPWCLGELAEILSYKRRNNQVVPVFYYVDPSDVRFQRGSFGDAFVSHKKRYSVDTVEKWKSALTEITMLSGYHLNKDANENESVTIQGIVRSILRPDCDIIDNVVDRDLLQINPMTSWDVFLSFHCVDTRFNFTDHLYGALDHHGIRSFKDDPDLHSGESISDACIQAIKESKAYIVVVSKNYASSGWCLDELVEILACSKLMGRLVIPLFYNIEPSVVHDQTKSLNEAFGKYKTRVDADRLAKWRVTLMNVAELSGYQVTKNTFEADIINRIVDEILLKMNPKTLDVAKYLVGLDSGVTEITRMITTWLSSDKKGVLRIGIHGMGGVGKTTLAKVVYSQNYSRFQGSCFLEDVRKVSGTERGLVCLQQQLISDVLKCKNINIGNVYQGIMLIRARICSTKVLIVIDDLDDSLPLEYLEGPFALGSIIIITSRNEDLLDSIKVEARYKVNELGDVESRRLFTQHAFGDNSIPDTMIKLSEEILECAGGLPLALKAFGLNFSKQFQTGMISIDKLKQLSIEDVEKTLLISYDGLKFVGPRVQDIFLDIACFFIGWKKEEVVKIMETCYIFVNRNIDILKKRCLLTVNSRDELEVHDLLRDMGRKIAQKNSPDQPGAHSRLWASEDIFNVLKKHEGTEAIEGIVSSDCNYRDAHEGVSFTTQTFKRMSKLRYLYLKKVNLTGRFEETFENLGWLFWDYCPLKCLPSEFSAKELVILELPHSKMTKLWELNMNSQVFEKLKTLNMKHSLDLVSTPDFTKLPSLETLNLEGCKSLKRVHISIGSAVRLVSFNLCGCVNIRSLPDSICNLRALKSLKLGGCTKLKALPVDLGNIKSLTELTVWGPNDLKLPDSIRRLAELDFNKNANLEFLPDLSNLRLLESLDIFECKKLSPELTPTRWDVFLSCCDDYTQMNFSSSLYSALELHGVRPYMNYPELCNEEVLPSTISRDIRKCKSYIVVLSESYAFSSWCLDELVEILNCHKTMQRVVIPVFYNIDKSVVQHQTGSYEKAFEKHQIHYVNELEKVKQWRLSLTELANIPGYRLYDGDRHESEAVEDIVENVAQVPTTVLPREEYLFGIESAIEEIYQKLSMESNSVRALGICGMGGIGKTTIATAFYNKYSTKFGISCSCEVVKRHSQGGSPLLPLLEQMSNQLLGTKKYMVRNDKYGIRQLKKILSSKRALVVLDNLDQSSYLEQLARLGPLGHLFSAGSRIIITTRDANLLNKLKVDISEVDTYMVKTLEPFDSLMLFSNYAFREPVPPENFKEPSVSFVNYAGGVPLSLKLLGSSLHGRTDVSFWTSKLKKVRNIPDFGIQEIIKLSYDELDDKTEKEMFLDIACFFVGEDKDKAVQIFKLCGFYPDAGIPNLVDKCLVTIDKHNKFQMHDLIQAMGKELGRSRRRFLLLGNEWKDLQNLQV